MKKIYLLFFVPLIASVSFGFFLRNRFLASKPLPTSLSQTPTPQSESVKIQVDFGDNKIESEYPYDANLNAFSLLEKIANDKGLTFKTKKYDFGIFVESIGDKIGSKEKAWIYFVNGNSGGVAADQYKIQKGDFVEWRYINPINQ
jgi:gamma-glutamylcyclotransferase (GGCT)/AIG2-like uncharacterized protein YtfP